VFFLFDANPTTQLLDVTPRMPTGEWQDRDGCDAVPGAPPGES